MTRPKDRVPEPDLDLVVLEVLLHALPDAVETECRDIVFLFACENLNCGSGRDTEKGCTRHCTHSGLGDGVLGRPGGLTRHTFMHASMHTEEAPRTEHPLTDGRYWDQIQDCRPNSRLSVWCSPPRVAPGRRTRQSFRAGRRQGLSSSECNQSKNEVG